MFGENQKITKNNLLKGIPWRFGPNWPGKRCEAKTRKWTPCQCPGELPVGRWGGMEVLVQGLGLKKA